MAIAVALIGHIILIVSAVPGVIEKKSALGAFCVGLVVTGLGALVSFYFSSLDGLTFGIGTGLFKANISPLIAEQYKRTKIFVVTNRHGERVIVDPALTISRMYMVSQSNQSSE